MKKKIKISIIVPVYNVERYLDHCLDSLVNQTFKDIEIIIVNDGSPDNSQQIIDEYKNKYPQLIKAFVKENGGVSSAKNFGLEHASGEYVLFIDSDDYVNINMVEKMYNVAYKENSDMVICDVYDVFEKNNKIIRYSNNFIGNTNIYENKKIIFNRPANWNKLIKKSLFNDFEFELNKWYEDMRISIKLYLLCKKITFIDEPLYYYVTHENSIMNNKNISKNYQIIDAFDDIINYYKENNLYDEFKEEINFLAIDHIFISASVRIIINSGKKELKENLTPILEYFNKNFNIKNKYVNMLDRNKKIIYTLLKHKMYNFVKFIFKIKGV